MSLRLLVVLMSFSVFGCRVVKSENQIYGRYELAARDSKIDLDVRENHSYLETINYGSGARQNKEGKWQWREGHVCFASLLIPEKLLTQVYQDLPEQQRPEMVGDAYQLDDCLSASRIYGRTVLEINPDSSDNFVRRNSDVDPQHD